MFFSLMRGYDDFGYGPNRSSWREKSDAAMDREEQAKGMFNSFLERLKEQPESAFPISEEIVPPQVHLTDACWKTFKK